MFNDKYNELKRLKEKNTKGTILIYIIFIILGYFIFASTINPNFILLKLSTNTIMVIAITCLIGIFIIYFFCCKPYKKYKEKLNLEIKNHIIQEELSNSFNNTYQKENIEDLKTKLNELNLKYHISIDDYFSAEYNHTNFKYADAYIYHRSDDDIVTDFYGTILIFDNKNIIKDDIYIGKSIKEFFFNSYNFSFFKNHRKHSDIKPTNNILNKTIAIKSNGNQDMIENQSFQQAINNIMSQNEYIIIYKNDKIYILIDNYINLFEININNTQEEEQAKEQIRNEIITLKEELDKILTYKEILNIRKNL